MLNADLYAEWLNYLVRRWGLEYEIAWRVAAAQTWLQQNRIPAVLITSGYRSPIRQQLLLDRWNSGDRSGLVAKPSNRSWHMQGLAIDVDTGGIGFVVFRDVMLYYGARWGGNFRNRDSVHFDYPIGRPKTIDQLLT